MILAPHALAGAAAALIFRKHPVIAVIAAFLSHFVLDAIPHWHYRLYSREEDKQAPFGDRITFGRESFKDLARISLDAGIGMTLTIAAAGIFLPKYAVLMFAGGVAGIIPDALQAVYFLFPDSPLFYLQWFHKKIHSRKNMDEDLLPGVVYQLCFSAAIVLIFILVKPVIQR